jgi:hypothetical protein
MMARCAVMALRRAASIALAVAVLVAGALPAMHMPS